MSDEPVEREGELRLAPESIEALALRLADLLAPREPARPHAQLITAEEVARWWGIGRRWVYDHADELGARRLGGGSRPRLRFDPDEVAERLGEPGLQDGVRVDEQPSASMRGDCRSDSLSPGGRAMVGQQSRKRPGRRANAPRPGAEQAGAMRRLLPRSPHVASARPAAGRPGGSR